MQKIMFNAWVKAQMAKQNAKEYFASEKGGADTVIIAVIIIVVVLAIGFVFRDTIIGWFNSLLGDASDQMGSASNMPSIGPT